MAAKAGMKNLWRQRMSKRSSPMPSRAMDCREMMAERYDASWGGGVSGRGRDRREIYA